MAFSSSSLSCPVSFLPLQKHLVPSHNYHHPRHRHHHHHRRKPLNSVQNNPLSTNSIHFSRTNPRFSMIKCLSQRQSTQQTPPPAKQEQQQQQDEYYEFERLFSSLNQATLKREPGSLSSAIFLVAGTTVGAGILAIPALTKEAGFLASAVACIICWIFMENELLHVPKGQAQNAQAQMFSDPNMAMDMMKKNLSMIISQMLTFAWVNFFFSGFVAAKIPFPLTQRFRSMLQNGIDLSTVDVSYFSSRSWYFLNLFGLRGLFSLILGEENAMDDTQRMIQMDGFGMDPTTIVYDPYERLNELADEVDKNAGLSRLTLFSPCKVNIFLRITRKREDGFHDLASLFHVISLGDKIKFSLSPSKTQDRLSTNVPGVPLDERNLIIKALNLYRKKTSSDKYFWIHLDKKVPTGAGLGGGSSNAATALWAANQFNDCLVSEKELQEWSSEIGSDVPFFFSHGVGYCTGRGEVVKDIPPPIPLDTPIVLIKPREACSTAEVYKRLCLDQTSKVDPLHLLEKISTNGIYQDVCINDLESPAFEVLPSLRRLKQRVIAASRGQYDAVFMSGSGSTIVGIGSPDPPQFIYDDEEYQDVFISEANFIIREANQWYSEPVSSSSTCPGAEFSQPGK